MSCSCPPSACSGPAVVLSPCCPTLRPPPVLLLSAWRLQLPCCCPLATLERALQSGTKEDNSRKEPQMLMSSPCPPVALFLAGPFRRKEEAGHSVRPCRRALSGCPPLLRLLQSLRLSSSCFFYCLLVILLHSSRSPLCVLPSCCPFGVVRSQLVLLLSSWLGVFVVFSCPHSFVLCYPPHVLLWSFCCRALYAAFQGRGCGRHHHNNDSS